MPPKRSVIIVAGGSGTRMGSSVPKQFLLLNELPVLAHTLACFRNTLAEATLVLVLPEHQISYWYALCEKHGIDAGNHRVVGGGESRFESVKNGLGAVGDCDFIAIHDGVRPLVTAKVINTCFEAAQQHGTAVPVVPVTDSLRIVNQSDSCIVDRTLYRQVQTPQCFERKVLLTAYQQPFNALFTDDASVVEASGVKIHLVDGDPQNIKITTPIDLLVAGEILKTRI